MTNWVALDSDDKWPYRVSEVGWKVQELWSQGIVSLRSEKNLKFIQLLFNRPLKISIFFLRLWQKKV